jgi:hypothetical protein
LRLDSFRKSLPRLSRLGLGLALGLALVWSSFFSEDFEGLMLKAANDTTIRRDYAASVISFGQGNGKWLLVNGIGMTKLTPITKFMAHLPLAFPQRPTQIGAGHLFWHGHDVSLRLELEY